MKLIFITATLVLLITVHQIPYADSARVHLKTMEENDKKNIDMLFGVKNGSTARVIANAKETFDKMRDVVLQELILDVFKLVGEYVTRKIDLYKLLSGFVKIFHDVFTKYIGDGLITLFPADKDLKAIFEKIEKYSNVVLNQLDEESLLNLLGISTGTEKAIRTHIPEATHSLVQVGAEIKKENNMHPGYYNCIDMLFMVSDPVFDALKSINKAVCDPCKVNTTEEIDQYFMLPDPDFGILKGIDVETAKENMRHPSSFNHMDMFFMISVSLFDALKNVNTILKYIQLGRKRNVNKVLKYEKPETKGNEKEALLSEQIVKKVHDSKVLFRMDLKYTHAKSKVLRPIRANKNNTATRKQNRAKKQIKNKNRKCKGLQRNKNRNCKRKGSKQNKKKNRKRKGSKRNKKILKKEQNGGKDGNNSSPIVEHGNGFISLSSDQWDKIFENRKRKGSKRNKKNGNNSSSDHENDQKMFKPDSRNLKNRSGRMV